MVTMFELKGSISIEPVWWNDPPMISIHIGDRELHDGEISQLQEFCFREHFEVGQQILSVKFYNKNDTDTDLEKNLDKAVMIKNIKFFDIESPHFVWNGIYVPTYPKSWIDDCQQQGKTLSPTLRYHDYLGWNGVWSLTFDVPIFSWIHKIENLGWVYD